MKKALSLLLAAVMALTLCVTAFAGGDTGTRVYLTGDAADEVTGLTSGQRIDAGGSTTVRLNVQSDPGAEEYTVKLDGEALKADHSTAQYHVYSLPADKLTAKTATLSVNGGVSTQAASANTLTVTVGDTPYPVNLSGGSRDVKNLTELSLSITNADGGFKQIYISGEGIKLYASWSKRSGTMSGAENFVAVSDKGFTKSDMYIYKTPKKQTQDVYITYTVGNTPYYYKLTITCPAAEGYALGPGYYDPAGNTISATRAYTEIQPYYSDGMIGGGSNYVFTYGEKKYTGWLKQAPGDNQQYGPVVAALAVYKNGTVQSVTYDGSTASFTNLAQPNWTALTTACNSLYSVSKSDSGATILTVNRPGFYWFPVSLTYENQELTGMLPMEVRANAAAANDYLAAAETARASFTDNKAAAKLLADAITTVTAAKDNLIRAVYVGDNGYTYTEPDDTKLAAVNTARTYYGAPITGAALVEKDLNILQDMAAIANATTLQAEKLEAYMKLMMSTGVHAAVDIHSGKDRDAYQNMRQAKWELLQAESVDALNGILDKFNLKHIGETEPEEPKCTLGDVDGDGKVTINDAGLIALYVNGYRTMNETQLKAADVTKSDGVTINDAGLIALYVNGFRSSLG